MSNVTIHINFPNILYSGKTNSSSLEDCDILIPGIFPVILVDTDISKNSLLSSYTGDFWKYLTITSITTSNPNFTLNYQGNPILNNNLPLVFNIQSLTQSEGPNSLFVSYPIGFNFINDVETININFFIEDINGTKGDSVQSSFQLVRKNCSIVTGNPPIITSPLYGAIFNPGYIIGNSSLIIGNFEYNIIASNNPNVFSSNNLPPFLILNYNTGVINHFPDINQSYNLGTYTFNISAKNSYGIDTKQFILDYEYTTGGDFFI